MSLEGIHESLIRCSALGHLLLSLGIELFGVFVDLQVLPVDPQAQAREVMARLLPVEWILDELTHLIDAVESNRHDHRRHIPDPVKRGGEHERRGEHEEEQDELEHVQVCERDWRRNNSLHGLVRGQTDLQLLVNFERGTLTYVAQPAMRLSDNLDAHGDPVTTVRWHEREESL